MFCDRKDYAVRATIGRDDFLIVEGSKNNDWLAQIIFLQSNRIAHVWSEYNFIEII